MTEQYSAEQIAERYSDQAYRDAFFRLLCLNSILIECIIGDDYKVPVSLYSCVKLTDYGNEYYRAMRHKNVGHAEAVIFCLLGLYHLDAYVDVMETDAQGIQKSLSQQIKDRNMLLPFVHGRLLYDKYANLFMDRQHNYLGVNETFQLLRNTPQGVFQVLNLITGPYGILESKSERYFFPRRGLRLRHCPDYTCNHPHTVELTTSMDASVNAQRKISGDVQRKESEHGSDWSLFLRDINAARMPTYKDFTFDPVILLIGDALTDEELGRLMSWLCLNADSDVQGTAIQVGVRGTPNEIVNQLNRAELMQLILTAKDKDIIAGIDTLVERGHIAVPHGEVRRPVINGHISFGRYSLHAELGEYGVRVQSSSYNIGPLRARRLIERMYDLSSVSARDELEWQLRKESGDSLEAKLEHYIQNEDPSTIIRDLVLLHRSNVIIAAEHLDLIEGVDDVDDLFVKTAAWKLGFSVIDENETHARFWKLHDRMLQQTRESPLSKSDAELEEIRGVAANYFTELESVLDDSLMYSAWALTNDHYASARPFTYRPAVDRSLAFDVLSRVGKAKKPYSFVFRDRNSLFPLMNGFGLLEEALSEFEASADEQLRSDAEVPPWINVQDLQRFPFVHRVPFLDLTRESRQSIKASLRDITSALVASEINDARNEWLHGRRTVADLDRLRLSLDKVGQAIRLIEESGFSRQRYALARYDEDGQGRRIAVLAAKSGRQLMLVRPSSFAWLGLPTLRSTWYVMHSARFAEPAEALRFSVQFESPFADMWSRYPIRPRLSRLSNDLAASAADGALVSGID